MDTPIIDGLKKYILEKNIRFHMPGHKGKDYFSMWADEVRKMDVTEVLGTDNLHDPKGIILESQRLAAKAFGAKKTLYSVNGTTGGIYGAISAVTKPGDRILIQRNCHRSVYNATIFNQLNCEYIHPVYNEKWNIVTGILADDVDRKIKEYPDIKAVVITNPSYYGICSNIKAIAEIVHKYDKILIVDEAHGSHFRFSENLPTTAIEAGADICIQSTHKTLPAFTQASMIHVGTDRVNVDRLKKMVSMYQTTSPSYLLLSSLDLARAYMESEGKNKLNQVIDYIRKSTSYLKGLDGVKVFDSDNINDKDIFDFDVMKLLIHVDTLSGAKLESILRRKYNIQLEMSDYFYGLALCSVYDDIQDVNQFVQAIEDILKNSKKGKIEINNVNQNYFGSISRYIEPKIEVPLHDAFHREKEIINMHKSIGAISGGFVIPYPPGIPILCPGEVVTSEIIEYIDSLKSNNVHVLGLLNKHEKEIEVIR